MRTHAGLVQQYAAWPSTTVPPPHWRNHLLPQPPTFLPLQHHLYDSIAINRKATQEKIEVRGAPSAPVVTVTGTERIGLLLDISRVLREWGYSVKKARVVSSVSETGVKTIKDTFELINLDSTAGLGDGLSDGERLAKLERALHERAFTSGSSMQAWERQQVNMYQSSLLTPGSRVYEVRVEGTDAPGLLHEIVQTFFTHGFAIIAARVTSLPNGKIRNSFRCRLTYLFERLLAHSDETSEADHLRALQTALQSLHPDHATYALPDTPPPDLKVTPPSPPEGPCCESSPEHQHQLPPPPPQSPQESINEAASLPPSLSLPDGPDHRPRPRSRSLDAHCTSTRGAGPHHYPSHVTSADKRHPPTIYEERPTEATTAGGSSEEGRQGDVTGVAMRSSFTLRSLSRVQFFSRIRLGAMCSAGFDRGHKRGRGSSNSDQQRQNQSGPDSCLKVKVWPTSFLSRLTMR
ncbi:unnamed protein product [Vitrella brassicaformis CCMP3155]|uniref:ACT domain-containing protein n=1 Tax=Vitrella brassicaformis (strain CCMP3155) TaxID=1169540 RepID=A0A0G4E9J1_VITBC|nr:unnamed protein product [Vitrella brassicaformis CCMP3155]|eukprot:CEL92547.1 unnamed protein product [Vitrella brassicaformis CCMP3155]